MSKVIEYQLRYEHLYMTFSDECKIHSYYDEPGYINAYFVECSYFYFNDGKWHRDDAPARIYSLTAKSTSGGHKDNGLEWYRYNIRYKPRCQKL